MRKKTSLLMRGTLVAGGLALALLFSPQDWPVLAVAGSASAPGQERGLGDLSTLAGEGTAVAGVGSAEPHTAVLNEVVSLEAIQAMNTRIRADQAAARVGRRRPFVPVPEGATARAAADSEPTEAASETSALALNDMRYFVEHDMPGSEVPTGERSTVMEPTTINLGDAVFYTGNWFAAKSTNGGSTFSYINPYTFFPSINGGFCCDQVSAYAPTQDMALWGLQYIDDGTTNTLRLARAIGSAGISANNWVYWNLSPQLVGFPNGVWFDYPSFTVGANSLYITSNAFFTSNDLFAGNTIIRISLSELAAGGSIGFQYFNSNIGTERVTEGAGTTVYWAGFTTTTQMRIHRWAEGSGTIFWDNVNLNAFNWLSRDGVATSPDGTNWALRADSRPTGAYVAGGIIGVMWTAKQGGARPKPYTVHARFNEATRALVSQGDIWHTDYAWMYPAVMPNVAGNLAGTLQIGGAASGTFAYPGTQMWVTDDITGASTTVGGLFFVSAGNDGPNNNAWGDFFTVRRHKTSPNTWVAASHALFGGGNGANAVPKYLWFGRERDNPTPAAITGPPPGSTLAGSSTTFFWNTGYAASQYWLYVGTTGPGSLDIWNEDQGLNTSRTVTGLPTNGATLYVRLWTLLPGGWVFNDYTYTAATLVPDISVTPSSFNFGNVNIGQSEDRIFNVQNLGNATLNVTATTITGVDASHYSIPAGGGAFSLAPAASRNVTVRFTPTSAGLKNAALSFTSNDPDENPHTTALSGTGVVPPNLVISALTGPALASPGQAITLSNTVTNNGGSAAGAFSVGLYLSADNVCTTGDTFLAVRAVGGLNVAGSNSANTPVTIPAATPLGAQFFCAIADTANAVFESNEGDNATFRSVDVVPTTPTVNLKVNGIDGAFVNTTGMVHLTLDISASTFTSNVDWYWAFFVNGSLFWVTASGLSSTPAPLLMAPPGALTGVTLLNLTLPPGTSITNAFFLVNGGSVLTSDVITANVTTSIAGGGR